MTRTLGVALVAAAILLAPLAHADDGDQASAEQAVTAAYNLKVTHACHATRNATPSVQSINWAQFTPNTFGRGTVHDADPRLGGDFEAHYNRPGAPQIPPNGPMPIKSGQWYVTFEFC